MAGGCAPWVAWRSEERAVPEPRPKPPPAGVAVVGVLLAGVVGVLRVAVEGGVDAPPAAGLSVSTALQCVVRILGSAK